MFTAQLLQWFDTHQRDLPWRHHTDAYAIWLSEIILQQTRIAQGTAYWHRFLQRFPTVESLAAATEDEVLRLWQGLGYYSRARNLHTAAQQVVERGGFPNTAEELRRLKGVGDYTAAAIAAFAYGQPVAAVDGNVYRVLSRIFGIETPIDTTKGKKEFAALAQSLVPTDRAADFNQAMMDFGATQCVPNGMPDCNICPFVETCVARRENRIGNLPVKEKKTKVIDRRITYIYIRWDGKTAIHRRGDGDIWQGLWEPLFSEGWTDCPPGAKLIASDVKHQLTHQRLRANFFLLEVTERPTLPPEYIWTAEAQLDNYAKPRLFEILLHHLYDHSNSTKA